LKLSIITVNLNNRSGLLKTIESVVNQIFVDFEYIIIDGGSSDGSVDVIDKYASSVSYWISEPDSGIYNAMNKGIGKANGEYLLFLNSGDFLVNHDVLTQVFRIGITHDIVIGNCNVSKNGKVFFHAKPPHDISLSAFWGKTIPHQAAFIKRDLFQKFGLYSENFRIHSDLEFFLKAFIAGNCSYLKIPVTISEYNLDGISSDQSFIDISESEKKIIFETLIPERVLMDYNLWDKERKDLEILFWANSKPIINALFKMIFRFSTFASTLQKKIFAEPPI
jgi:glycosyltransferase involved in cell wall biosynthesis